MRRNNILLAAAAILVMAGCGSSNNTPLPEQKPGEPGTQTVRAFSHRGGRLEHDENTMPAFVASWEAGYTGFETDVRMTSDGHLVITHDHTLERTTNGSGILEEKTFDEVMALTTKKGNKMLTVDELSAFFKGKSGLYVEWELKTKPVELYPEERLHEYCNKLYDAVMCNKPEDAMYVFTSSDPRGLLYLREQHPDVNLLWITSKPVNSETIAACLELGIPRLGAKMDGTSRASVKKAHDAGLIVSLWPGQSVADFMLGTYLGCDFMCTDVPLAVMDFMQKRASWVNVIY